MDAKQQFETLCGMFYQCSRELYPSFESWVQGSADMLNVLQKQAAQSYLEELLQRNPTEEYLEGIWRATQADYFFSKGGYRHLFDQMLAACKQNLF